MDTLANTHQHTLLRSASLASLRAKWHPSTCRRSNGVASTTLARTVSLQLLLPFRVPSRFLRINVSGIPRLFRVNASADMIDLVRHVPGRLPVSPVFLYSLAAALPPSVVGFTFTVMWDGVQALEAKAAGKADAPSEAETKSLVAKWTSQNYVRSAIVGSAAVLSAVAFFA